MNAQSSVTRIGPHHLGAFFIEVALVRHEFQPGEEPTVYTADICAEVGRDHCEGVDRTIEGYEGEPVFCNCLCHRLVEGEPN
jgi:hypothetical protein